jgi:hypothetical protein
LPKNGDSILHTENKYTKFSVRVVGNKAKEVFTQHLQAMQQKDAKVIVSLGFLCNLAFYNIFTILLKNNFAVNFQAFYSN